MCRTARGHRSGAFSDTPLHRPQVKLTAPADSQHSRIDHPSLGMINASLARAVIPDAGFFMVCPPATLPIMFLLGSKISYARVVPLRQGSRLAGSPSPWGSEDNPTWRVLGENDPHDPP